ncbi:unnamed protein product [Macrosiphum euphorbiae]|uniref:DDE Tnp4 domain-containing protein n=1 Tax=Macrosiphum euphorbiae TaxID=13131 RepID=A0AAV0WZY9_9HEMI|nr:unnamed protein product [Macrosiphum euphorbiae]
MSRAVYNALLITEDSDSSDFEEEMSAFNVCVRKIKTFNPRIDYFNLLDENEFIRRFRLKKSTFDKVLNEIVDQIKNSTDRNNSIDPIIQLLVTLRFYATGNFLITVGDFGGISVASAGKIVERVSYALAFLSSRYIRLPETPEEKMELKVQFYGLARFPKVIGAIDCTHIKLQCPSRENGELYRNRKGYFSLNVQALVNANLEFMDVVVRWPGSAHDSNIFANSRLKARMELPEFSDCIILGDSGYALSHYLLTPLARTTTNAERLYNESQIRSRNVVERTFGVWKRRFPVLFFGLRLKMETTMAVIQACAVLHNIARLQRDPQPPDDIENIKQLLSAEISEIEAATQPQINSPAQALRNALVIEHFSVL